MATESKKADTVQFSIRLHKKAAEALEDLVESGVYGSSRAEVAKSIILRYLQDQRTAGAGKS